MDDIIYYFECHECDLSLDIKIVECDEEDYTLLQYCPLCSSVHTSIESDQE